MNELIQAPLLAYQPVSRRGFFELILFTVLALFVTRKTQAKVLVPKLESKPIPAGLYISQCVGRGRPVYPQEPIPTAKLKSVVEPLDFGYNRAQDGPTGPLRNPFKDWKIESSK